MKVTHRIFGDPPSGGYLGGVIGSVGFPGGARWADAMESARLPITRQGERRADDFTVYAEAYEYQTLGFGRPAVIRSMAAAKAAARPHGFTHIAAPEGDVSPAQLLSYTAFLTLDEFWNFPAGKAAYPATDWQAPEENTLRWQSPAAPSRELAEALILRYWQALSARAFGDSPTVQPVEIILSDTADAQAMIAQAKAFFLAEIAPRLPGAALRILSMSVPARQTDAQCFQPTAMLFLTPEETIVESDRLFDFRTMRFTPLSVWDAEFIARIMRGERSPATRHALATWQAEGGDPARCTFLADCRIIRGIERMERADARQTPLEPLLIWRGLTRRLRKAHGIDARLCARMLAPVARIALGQLNALPEAPPMQKEHLRFLFSAALAAERERPDILTLITRHQAAGAEPFFLSAFPWDCLQDHTPVIADMLRGILETCYTNPAPDAQVLRALQSEQLANACARHPELDQIMQTYVKTLALGYPELSLDLLPLANRYAGPVGVLYNTVGLLIARHTGTAPDAELCQNLRRMLASCGEEDVRGLLDPYFDLLFWKQRNDPAVLPRTATAIGADMTGAVCQILRTAAETPGDPLTREDLTMLTDGLHEQIENPEAVRDAMLEYIDAVFKASPDTGLEWFAWLTGLDIPGDWFPEDARVLRAVAFLPVWIQKRGLPDGSRIAQLIAWLEAGHHPAFLENESQYLAAYDALAEAGDAQLKLLLPWFSDVTNAPYVRTRYLQWLAEQAADGWDAARRTLTDAREAEAAYWEDAARLRQTLAVCGEPPEALLTGRAGEAADALLARIFEDLRLPTAAYASLFETRAQQPDDRFKALWREALHSAFTAHYRHILSTPLTSLKELSGLEAAKTAIGAQGALAGSPEERFCLDTLSAEAFCLEPENRSDDDLAARTREIVARLREDMQKTHTDYPLQALCRRLSQPDAWEKIRARSRAAQLSAALIATCRADGELPAKALLLTLLGPGSAVPGKPYAPEALPFLQTVVWLFEAFTPFDPAYPGRLAKAMLTDPELAAYTARLHIARAQFARYFPRFSPVGPAAEAQPPSPLQLWLRS